MNLSSKIPASWHPYLKSEFDKSYFVSLQNFLSDESRQGKVIFPSEDNIFRALELVEVSNIKVVILGQDPYHNIGQAHGLSFSVPRGVKPPPSLKNIYKELKTDADFIIPDHGDLSSWSDQGVLLLNSMLTVEAHKAGSHQKKGWEAFTDKMIEIIDRETQNTVFILWGSYAHKKGKRIDRLKHLVLESVHPSPLSAYRGFLGCKHFSKANSYLEKYAQTPIDWSL